MTAALEGDEWSAARPSRTLPPGKTRYPFYRRLGGPQGRSGRGGKSRPYRDSIPDGPACSQSWATLCNSTYFILLFCYYSKRLLFLFCFLCVPYFVFVHLHFICVVLMFLCWLCNWHLCFWADTSRNIYGIELLFNWSEIYLATVLKQTPHLKGVLEIKMDVSVELRVPATLIPGKNSPVFIRFEANRVVMWVWTLR